MNQSLRGTTLLNPKRASSLPGEEENRKKRLMLLLNKGLPTLPAYLLDLNALLNQPSVDLKKVGKVIRTDPSLTAQVLRLCNSAMFGLRRRVVSIEQAAVLIGTERLRTLALTCSMMKFAGEHMPINLMVNFWQHSFLAALLSERIAAQLEYAEKEQAYLGGLLHDIGQLPLWMLVGEEQAKGRALPPDRWMDDVQLERGYFGTDHGKVGRSMGVSWNFMPSFMDVFEHHHHPENAKHDPYLVGIVSAADQFLMSQRVENEAEEPAGADAKVARAVEQPGVSEAGENATFLLRCLPNLAEEEQHAILEMLQTEYMHVLPLVQLGLAAITPETSGQKPRLGHKSEETTRSHRG